MKKVLATALVAMSLVSTVAHASDKDFPPGCLFGADNSRSALVVLDNYTASHGSNVGIERLKKTLQSGQTVFIDGQLLTSLNISDADAKVILAQIKAADNAN